MTTYFTDKARIDAMKEVNYKSANWRVNTRNELFEMLDIFDKLATKHNLRYFIINGTLLGATKFQGIIPWDDDSDIGIFFEDIPKLKELVKEFPYNFKESIYGYICQGKKSFAMFDFIIFDRDPLSPENFEMCYPYISGKKTFWARYWRPMKINEKDLFPLIRYKYDHLSLLGPKNGRKICLNIYDDKVYERNQRPDGGYGCHPIIPLVLPPLNASWRIFFGPLIKRMPNIFVDSILKLNRGR